MNQEIQWVYPVALTWCTSAIRGQPYARNGLRNDVLCCPGVKLNIPCNAEALAVAQYGRYWRLPVHEWSW